VIFTPRQTLKLNVINVSKAIINHTYFDGLYQPFMGKVRMVSYCFTNMVGKTWENVSQLKTHPVPRTRSKAFGSTADLASFGMLGRDRSNEWTETIHDQPI
jgi:hypothetical protein